METGKANKIQADNFNVDLCEQSHLAVEIGLENLSYCIINKKTNNVEYLKHIIVNDDYSTNLNNEEILKKKFASSSVSFTDFPCTLVPNELSQEENLKEILELNSETYDIIQSDEISNIKTTLIYTIPNLMHDIAFTFFPNAKQKAQQSVLIEQFYKFENNNDNAYLHISNSNLNIYAFKNGKLILHNEFDFKTKEDLLYYIMFTFEQLEINPETVRVKLYGNIIKGDETHQLLYEYIKNVEFGLRPENINFSSKFNEIQQHKYYGLFSQYK